MIIFLAGGETWGELFLDMGVPFQLYSYYYIRNKLRNKRESGKMLDLLARMKYAVDKTRGRKDCLPYKFMLDSGAFTYHSQFAQATKMNKPCNLPKPDVYFEEYLEFVEAYHDIFDVIVEFDIDDVHEGVTRDHVDVWTNRLLETSPEIAAKTMPVYHGRRGKEWLRDWCLDTRSPLMGIGSEDVDIVVETINTGHRCGKYIHGFGQTQVKSLLLKTQYDSVDSTSVSGDTCVWVRRKDGTTRYLPIEELYEGSPERVEVIGPHRRKKLKSAETLTLFRRGDQYEPDWGKLHSVIEHDVKKVCYELSMETGETICVTEDHSVFSMSSEGELVETKPKDLHVGSWIVAASCAPWGGKGVETLESSFTSRGPGGRILGEFSVITELDEDMLLFFGMWVAEGSYNREASVWITNSSPEAEELCKRIAERWGTLKTYRKDVDSVSHSINSASLAQTMRQFGFNGLAPEKHLPDFFWSLSEEQACTFLKGMFSGDGSLETDGYGTVKYFSTSRRLIEQTQAALLCLVGGPVTITKDGKGYAPQEGYGNYDLHVLALSSQQVKREYMDKIGFMQAERKHEFPKVGSARKQSLHGLPMSLARTRIKRPNSGGVYVTAKTERVGRWAVVAAPNAFHPAVASPDVCYTRIVGIKELPKENRKMYDLSVVGTERFLAGSLFVLKNTWLNTDKFGTTYIFENSKFITYDLYHKLDRQKHKQYYERWGLDFKKVCEDDLATMRKSAIIAWRELALDFYRKWLVRTDGGKYPLLYKLHLEGRVPSEHPLLTRAQIGRQLTNEGIVG